MTQTINQNRLFNASCFALITTAFSFSISAGTLDGLGKDLKYSAESLGYIQSLWFFGFPIAMIIGGLIYHTVGPKRIMNLAFLTHFLGVGLTLYAIYFVSDLSFNLLLVSNLLLGIGCGCTEAACNPMIADMYSGSKLNKMLNRFHMWFPGGIFLGAIISEIMTRMGYSWQIQFWLIPIPALVYAFLFFGQKFPESKEVQAKSIASNIKAMFSPLFIFLFICMALTAISEFGPSKWAGIVLKSSGASGMLIVALSAGVMAVGRFFAGPVVKALGQTGVLLGGAIFASIGIFLFSTVTGNLAYLAALIFAIGLCYFWPVMVGAVAQRVPLSGALGMSIIGGVGMFSTAIFQPIIGAWIDDAKKEATDEGLTGNIMELVAGQTTLQKMILFPGILIVLFIIFFIWQRGVKPAAEAGH